MKLEQQVCTRIYTLSNPSTDTIFYVGKTIKPLNDRLSEHITECRRVTNMRTNAIKSLLKNGLLPKIELVEECYDNWEMNEMYWISQFKAWGFNLKNMTDGGEGAYGRIISEETRQKMSVWQKGIKKKQEHILACRNGRMAKGGYKSTEIIRMKQSLALKGISKTTEHSKKVSLANKGKKMSESFRKNQSERMKGIAWASKPVKSTCPKTGVCNIYKSLTEAHQNTGILITSITNSLTGRSKTAGGLKWSYINNVAA